MSWTRKGIRFWKPWKGRSPPRSEDPPPASLMSAPGKEVRSGCHPLRTGVAISPPGSDQSLVHHGVGDLEEARDVRPVHVVAGRPELLGRPQARLVDALHDHPQPVVHLLAGPAVAHAVLGHLEARNRNASGVGGLGRAVEDAAV